MTNTTNKNNSARDINVPTKDDELRYQLKQIFVDDDSYSSETSTLHDASIMSEKLLQLIKQREEQVAREAENYGRLASLADLLTWLKLHDIEDVSMVQGYVEHCTKSVSQFPDQRYVDHSDLKAQLTITHKGDQ